MRHVIKIAIICRAADFEKMANERIDIQGVKGLLDLKSALESGPAGHEKWPHCFLLVIIPVLAFHSCVIGLFLSKEKRKERG